MYSRTGVARSKVPIPEIGCRAPHNDSSICLGARKLTSYVPESAEFVGCILRSVMQPLSGTCYLPSLFPFFFKIIKRFYTSLQHFRSRLKQCLCLGVRDFGASVLDCGGADLVRHTAFGRSYRPRYFAPPFGLHDWAGAVVSTASERLPP